MKSFLVLLICLTISACAFKRGEESVQNKSTEEIARELREQEERQLVASKMNLGQFKIHVDPTSKPNEYVLVVEWDKQNIKVEFAGEIDKFRSVRGSATESPFRFPLNGGDAFPLIIKALTLKDVLVFDGSAKIEVPKDYVFSTSLRLSENLLVNAQRVFVLKDVVISTLQFQLNVIANEVIFDSSTIQNFDLSDSAAYQTSGLSGGSVIIKAKKAIGTIFLRPRGQGGGHGYDGAVEPSLAGRHPGCAPGSGANGGSGGTMLFDIADDSNLNPLFFSSISAGGPKGVRGVNANALPGGPGTARMPPCDRDDPDVSVAGAPGPTGAVCFIGTASKHQGCLAPTP